MKILVIGSWEKHKADICKNEAAALGRELAKNKCILMSGGGEGVSEMVVNSYKTNGGSKYICYIPSKEQMDEVGEKLGPQPDELIKTNMDYPERNIVMVRECDSVIALNGGLGTLTEVIHAVKDYKKKVSVIDVGDFSVWIKSIGELRDRVLVTSNINEAVSYLL